MLKKNKSKWLNLIGIERNYNLDEKRFDKILNEIVKNNSKVLKKSFNDRNDEISVFWNVIKDKLLNVYGFVKMTEIILDKKENTEIILNKKRFKTDIYIMMLHFTEYKSELLDILDIVKSDNVSDKKFNKIVSKIIKKNFYVLFFSDYENKEETCCKIFERNLLKCNGFEKKHK